MGRTLLRIPALVDPGCFGDTCAVDSVHRSPRAKLIYWANPPTHPGSCRSGMLRRAKVELVRVELTSGQNAYKLSTYLAVT
jgi:hypothetical protein